MHYYKVKNSLSQTIVVRDHLYNFINTKLKQIKVLAFNSVLLIKMASSHGSTLLICNNKV